MHRAAALLTAGEAVAHPGHGAAGSHLHGFSPELAHKVTTSCKPFDSG
jgi:hypothetical protein